MHKRKMPFIDHLNQNAIQYGIVAFAAEFLIFYSAGILGGLL